MLPGVMRIFSVRCKPGVTWSSPAGRGSASRGNLPRWNKVGKCFKKDHYSRPLICSHFEEKFSDFKVVRKYTDYLSLS